MTCSHETKPLLRLNGFIRGDMRANSRRRSRARTCAAEIRRPPRGESPKVGLQPTRERREPSLCYPSPFRPLGASFEEVIRPCRDSAPKPGRA